MHKKIKILYLDVNLTYINPTRNLVPAVLKSECEVVFYGPGYSDTESLRKGLNHFNELNGPFDAIIASEHIIFSSVLEEKALLKSYRASYVTQFDLKDVAYAREIQDTFIKRGGLKCVTLFESDYYNFPMSQIDVIEKSGSYVIGWGEQFVRPIHELTHLENEAFAIHANDNWHNFIVKNGQRIISLPAFVGEAEFSWAPIGHRSQPWSVVGARYWARNEARKALKASGIGCPGDQFTSVISFLDHTGFRPYANSYIQKNKNHAFRRAISSSRYSYTCGSGLGYPIRKFYEIPALGAVLVCVPCSGFEAMGFKNGVNAITCVPEEVLKIHWELEQNPVRSQKIASAGRDFVWQNHTVRSRSKQIYESLLAILEGRFRGSFWEDGKYCMKNKSSDYSEKIVRVDLL